MWERPFSRYSLLIVEQHDVILQIMGGVHVMTREEDSKMIMVQLDKRKTKTGTLGMFLQSCSYAVGRILAARGARWPRRVKQGASKRCHGWGQRHTGHAGGAVSKLSNKSRRQPELSGRWYEPEFHSIISLLRKEMQLGGIRAWRGPYLGGGSWVREEGKMEKQIGWGF